MEPFVAYPCGGRENLIHGRGFVIAANHLSDLDPAFVIIARFFGRRMKILAKAELYNNPVVGFVLSCLGAVPIARGKGTPARSTK